MNLQAYRTDKWTGYHLVPGGDGAPFFTLLRGTYSTWSRSRARRRGGVVVGDRPC